MENILIMACIISLLFIFVILLSFKYKFQRTDELNILIYLFLCLPFLGTQKYGEGLFSSILLRFIVYLFILIFAFFIKRRIHLVKNDLSLFLKLSYPLLLFILYNFITALYIPDYWAWVIFKNGELFFNYIICLIIFLFISGEKESRNNLLNIYYKFNILLMFLIIIEALLLPSGALMPDNTPWGFRLVLVWPYSTAGTVTVVGVVVFLLTLNKEKLRFIDNILLALSILLIVLGGTRNKIVGLSAGIISLFVISKSSRKYIIFAMSVILPFILIYGLQDIWDTIYNGIFMRGSEISVSTFSGRTTTWEALKPLFWKSPILGNGYYAAGRFLGPIYAPWIASVTLEGMWPNILVGSGIIGAILIAGFILKVTIVITKCIKKIPSNSDNYTILKGILLLWIVILIGSVSTDSFSFQSFESVSLSIIMAMLFRIYQRLNNGKISKA
jgi:O-antigen ligase